MDFNMGEEIYKLIREQKKNFISKKKISVWGSKFGSGNSKLESGLINIV